MIAPHIPDGLVAAFLASLPAGCQIVSPPAEGINQTAFMLYSLPVLITNAGKVAGVNSKCVAAVASNAATSLCLVEGGCLRSYLLGISTLPLIGRFVPAWATDVLVDLCAVRKGQSTLRDFFDHHLATVAHQAATMLGQSGASAQEGACGAAIDKVAAGLDAGATADATLVCKGLRVEQADCLDVLLKKLASDPILGSAVPEGVSDLLKESCSFIAGQDATVFALLPHLPKLLKVLASVLGAPSDKCGAELTAAVAPMVGSSDTATGFDSKVFCAALSEQCTSEVVRTVSGLPFVGASLPDGTDQLIGATCAVVKDRSNFAALVEHLPTLFDVVGRMVTGPHMPLSDECRGNVQNFLFTRQCQSPNDAVRKAGCKFRPANLCVLSQQCTTELVGALQQLPLVGAQVPDSISGLLREMCDIQTQVQASGTLKLSDSVSDSQSVAVMLPQILGLLGRVVGNQGASHRVLKFYQKSHGGRHMADMHGCGDKLTAYAASHSAVVISELCTALPGECMVLVSEKLETIPLVNAFVPARTGELLATSCDVIAAAGDAREVVLERLPSLLSVAAVFLQGQGVDGNCTARVDSVGALFKSRLGAIDGKDLCAAMPNAQCLGDVARALKQLPFVGASIPHGVDTLVGATCDIIAPSASASQQSLAAYLAAQGPVLLGLAAMATGVSTECEAALARATLVSAAQLCAQAGAKCLDELVQGLPTVPLVGSYLPGSVPPLFDGICAFAARAQGFAEFAAQTLPKLLKIVGLAATGSEDCATQLATLGLKSFKDGSVDLLALCRAEDKCLALLVDGLERVPLWGPLVPSDAKPLVLNACQLQRQEATATMQMSLADKLRHMLGGQMRVVARLAVNLGKPSATCGAQVLGAADAMDRDFAATGSFKPVPALCQALDAQCSEELVRDYRALPLFGQLVPADADKLIQLVCPVARKSGQELISAVFDKGGFLDQLPKALPAIAAFVTVSPACDAKLRAAAQGPRAGLPGSWQSVLACDIGEPCLGQMVDAAVKLPMLDALVASVVDTEADRKPFLASVRSIIVDQRCVQDPASNSNNGGSLQDIKSSSTSGGTIAGIVVLVIVLVLGAAGGYVYYRRRLARAAENAAGPTDEVGAVVAFGGDAGPTSTYTAEAAAAEGLKKKHTSASLKDMGTNRLSRQDSRAIVPGTGLADKGAYSSHFEEAMTPFGRAASKVREPRSPGSAGSGSGRLMVVPDAFASDETVGTTSPKSKNTFSRA